MINTFDCKYEVIYEMVNSYGLMKPRTIIEIFMECAIKHCKHVGYDVFKMHRDGISWVLRGGNYIINKIPKYSDKIKIKTWISKWGTFQGFREFILTDLNDKVLVSCSSVWAMFDIVKRIPHKVEEIFKSKWNYNELTATDVVLPKQPFEFQDVICKKDIKVMRRDIDTNMHVHNLSYIDWVFETLPKEYLSKNLLNYSGSFFKEIQNVDNSIRCVVGNGSDGELIHNIVSQDENIVYATGKTLWS